jgi:hypothetical protein
MNFNKYNINDPNIFPLILSNRFIRILKIINDDISLKILNLAKNREKFKESFIDVTDTVDMITLISSDKVNKMIEEKDSDILKNCWSHDNRNTKKIGRFVFSLFGESVSNTAIENFVNEYKSIIHSITLRRNFRIVEGEEIRKWYLSSNYTIGGGNLKNSCMRHAYCQRFFDIYTLNPDKIKLLILLDETKEKILGRALLWFLDRPDGAIFMDRVYFSSDFILNVFINHAIKNRWYYKFESMDNIYQVVYDNKVVRLTMVTKVKKEEYSSFPFIDNLAFYDPKLYTLSNDPKYFKSLGSNKYYDLCTQTGEYEVRTDFDF